MKKKKRCPLIQEDNNNNNRTSLEKRKVKQGKLPGKSSLSLVGLVLTATTAILRIHFLNTSAFVGNIMSQSFHL